MRAPWPPGAPCPNPRTTVAPSRLAAPGCRTDTPKEINGRKKPATTCGLGGTNDGRPRNPSWRLWPRVGRSGETILWTRPPGAAAPAKPMSFNSRREGIARSDGVGKAGGGVGAQAGAGAAAKVVADATIGGTRTSHTKKDLWLNLSADA